MYTRVLNLSVFLKSSFFSLFVKAHQMLAFRIRKHGTTARRTRRKCHDLVTFPKCSRHFLRMAVYVLFVYVYVYVYFTNGRYSECLSLMYATNKNKI